MKIIKTPYGSDLNVFQNVDTLELNDITFKSKEWKDILSNKMNKTFHVEPKQKGSYAFGGNYLDISSNKSLVAIYGVNKLKIHDRDMSLEK